MGTEAHVRTVHDRSTAVGWVGDRTVTIDRPREAGGSGLGFSGGDLLLLAAGACFTNDLFREADAMGIDVQNVDVDVSCSWGGDPVRAQDVTLDVRVEADASEEAIRELVDHTAGVAEIEATLRHPTDVTLGSVRTAPRA